MALDGLVAVRIAAGGATSFAVTDSGALFSWGHHEYTGHGDIEEVSVLEPRRVAALTEHVADVAASYFHTMVVGARGQLWTFGDNDLGQLGTGDRERRRSPTW